MGPARLRALSAFWDEIVVAMDGLPFVLRGREAEERAQSTLQERAAVYAVGQ